MNHSQNHRRSDAMGTRLCDWPHNRLLLRCGGCKSMSAIPLDLLRSDYGDEQQLSAIVIRLRCHRAACRAQPDYVRIKGYTNARHTGELHSVLLVGVGALG